MSLVNVFYKRIINTDNQIYKSILNKLNTISCLFLSTELAVICLLSIGGSWACKITETQALCPKKLSVKTDISIYCSFKVFFLELYFGYMQIMFLHIRFKDKIYYQTIQNSFN